MEKEEFLLSVPNIIAHKAWGYGELEIVSDTKDTKGACYRHENKTASCGSYATSWAELYVKFSRYLIKEGYMRTD